MPIFQSPGIASGIDVNSLVTQLVAAERAPTELRLARSEEKVKTQVTALGQLKGALSALLSSIATIKTESVFLARKAVSSAPDNFTATAAANAVPGNYSVEVLAVASAHKLRSSVFAGGASAAIGTGTLTLAVGSQSFDVVIDGTNNTLTGIRDAINSATDNKGVRASIVKSAAGAVLSLTANNTGADKALRVTVAGGDGNLAPLVYDPGVLTNMIEDTPAQDASISVDGLAATAAGNTFADLIDGVTITVLAADAGTVHQLTVDNDGGAVLDKVKKVITDFNAAAVTMAQLRKYDPNTKEAGALLGDAMLRGIESTLRGMLADTVKSGTEPYDTLASVGITTQQGGTLKLDEGKFNAALGASFDAVGRLFGSVDGAAARMHAFLDAQLKSDAALSSRTNALNEQRRLNDRDRERLDVRMKAVEARYRKQFSALDTVLAGLQQTSSFIAQRLGSNS